MRQVSPEQIRQRLQVENPWWSLPTPMAARFAELEPRGYLDLLYPLVREPSIHRAVLLLGPRRVGKTVLIHHAIQRLLLEGVPPRQICYITIDHPIYNGCSLDELMDLYRAAASPSGTEQSFVFFDEIQYLREWEVHLKAQVDTLPRVRFLASGSAAAALRIKGRESGAGRFTEFLLPPLTFPEYVQLTGNGRLVSPMPEPPGFRAEDPRVLNQVFLGFLNFGGYPELALTPSIQSDPARFIKSDIIDKVLLRDLPSLYGIQDIQELNHLFTTLAFNTANEVSLIELSKNSGVARNTIKKYIEYLEAAFLIKTVHRIDRNARRFQRANFFKVYLTNPSIHSALFAPVSGDDPALGSLVETAVYAQWFHSDIDLHYARWPRGEVDIVGLGVDQRVEWVCEVKFSDRYFEHPRELRSLIAFAREHSLHEAVVTTATKRGIQNVDGCALHFVPASLYCYIIGWNALRGKDKQSPAVLLHGPQG